MLRNLLLVSLIAACGARGDSNGPSAPSSPAAESRLPDGPPLVTPGERMAYRLSLGGVELATFDIGVGEITEVAGHKAIVVQSHAKATGFVNAVVNVDDVFTSWIDIETGRPLLWVVDEYALRGVDKEHTEARLHDRAGNTVPVDFRLNDRPPVAEPQTVSLPDAWDYNAFLVALRAWEAPLGSRVTSEVFRSRYMWNVTMTVRGRETLVTELGDLPALRFDGRAFRLTRDNKRAAGNVERQFSIWISDDDGRVPLQTSGRTDYGDVKLQIIDYQPGNGRRLRSSPAITSSDRPSSGTASRRSP